jgi:hypothetical protein
MGEKSGSRSGMNSHDHDSESLKPFFGLKYFNSLMRIRDPGWKKFGSGSATLAKNIFLPFKELNLWEPK